MKYLKKDNYVIKRMIPPFRGHAWLFSVKPKNLLGLCNPHGLLRSYWGSLNY